MDEEWEIPVTQPLGSEVEASDMVKAVKARGGTLKPYALSLMGTHYTLVVRAETKELSKAKFQRCMEGLELRLGM